MISIIIPANNEEGYIGDCLKYILQSSLLDAQQSGFSGQIVVVANGCSDGTVAEATAMKQAVEAKGWVLSVISLAEGSKIKALNEGDRVATFENRIYIDADIHVSSGLVAAIVTALDRSDPAFVSGCPEVRPAKSWVSERYARFWERLPFLTHGVPGCGVYCVNRAARARWGTFPDLISDDFFVRSHFADSEMHKVPHSYSFPITENFGNLVRVRRRQNEGLQEIRHKLPALSSQVSQTRPTASQTLMLFLKDPVGFIVYSTVAVAVWTPLFKNSSKWQRGR